AVVGHESNLVGGVGRRRGGDQNGERHRPERALDLVRTKHRQSPDRFSLTHAARRRRCRPPKFSIQNSGMPQAPYGRGAPDRRRPDHAIPERPMTPAAEPTGAEVFLQRLGELGIDTIFANAGTDFPPIVEALAKAAVRDRPLRAIAVPHENLAVSIAYGHYLISGRPQVIMLHVNVGTANAVCALMNAYRERIPLVVAAGRTPFTETGHAGSRSLFIHWAQEMFDQASLVRETVKWDYEVRMPDQIRAALDRAFSLATSDPRGPVYLTLPREVLAAPVPPESRPASRQPSLR